jgi:hypothetical protein
MSEITNDAARAAAFLETKRRFDFEMRGKFKRSGKTRGKVKCNPPNKPCKGRCIPPSWNCRAKGEGTDTHSKALEFDLVGGANNVIRGAKNVITGIKKQDPEVVTRGIKGIQRGIVKATPGNSLDDKARLARRLKLIGSIAAVGLFSGYALNKTHIFLKNASGNYRNGFGKDVDDAVAKSVKSVLDTWDAQVDRMGVGGVVGTGRARIARAGTTAATRLGRQGAITNIYENKFSSSARDINYLQTRARLRGGAAGMSTVNDIDSRAISEGWSRDRWEAEKIRALYSMRTSTNVSVFAQPAAHEMLAAQWGFELPPRSLRELSRVNETNRVRGQLLPQAIKRMHIDLHADLARRGIPATQAGFKAYANQLLVETPSILGTKGTADQRKKLEQEFRYRLNELLGATSSSQQRSLASDTYKRTVGFFDNYFTEAADRLTLNESGVLRIRPVQPDSPFGDAAAGLSRIHVARNSPNKAWARNGVPDRETASFLNGWYFHSKVKERKTPYLIRDQNNAISLASKFSGRSISTREEAVNWLNQNGFNVRVPEPRTNFGAQRPNQTPIGSSRPRRARSNSPRGRQAQRALTERARAIMARPGNEGMDLATALRLARDEQRGDSAMPPRVAAYLQLRNDLKGGKTRTGKRCGKGFIPKEHECNSGVKTAAKVALAAGVVAGGVYALKKARLNEFHTGFAVGKPNVGPVRMRRTSYMQKKQPGMTADNLASVFDGLGNAPGATPENVQALQNFIKKNRIYSDPSKFYDDLSAGIDKYSTQIKSPQKEQLIEAVKMQDKFGLMNGMASQYSDNVFIRNSRKNFDKLDADPNKVASVMKDFMDKRAANPNPIPQEGKIYEQLFITSLGSDDGDVTELIHGVHEISHKVHFKATQNKGIKPDDMQFSMYDPINSPEFLEKVGLNKNPDNQSLSNFMANQIAARRQVRDALAAISSEYGRSDLLGRKAETFAELSVLYVTQGKLFKERHPLAYAWVDDIWKVANG